MCIPVLSVVNLSTLYRLLFTFAHVLDENVFVVELKILGGQLPSASADNPSPSEITVDRFISFFYTRLSASRALADLAIFRLA